MKNFVKILVLDLMISLSINGQENSVITEMYLFHSPVPRFNENELKKEISLLYANCVKDTFYTLNITISEIGKPIMVETSDKKRKDQLSEIIFKYNNWIAGRKDFKFSETVYSYRINCKNGKAKVETFFKADRLKKYEIQQFDFNKGMILALNEDVKPFMSYQIKNYIEDTSGKEVLNSNRFRSKNRERLIRVEISPDIFKSDSYIILINKTSDELIRIKKDQNYIYLPDSSTVSILAIRRKKGQMIKESLVLTQDYYLKENWERSSYRKLKEELESW